MFEILPNDPKVALPLFASNRLVLDLEQARVHQEARPELANPLYGKVEVALLELAEQQGVKPLDPEALLIECDLPKIPEHIALRQRIAEVFFEHGKVFDQLIQADQAQVCYQKAKIWGHPDAAMQLKRWLPTSGPRFSLGQRAAFPAHYVATEQSASLLKLLKDQPNAIIEVVGPSGAGKTTLLQHLICPSLNPFFASYDLIAWIDCSSVSRTYADIQAISHALGHSQTSPQVALQQVANYVQRHPRSLLLLDGLMSSNVDQVLMWLNPSLRSGQLIYTTPQTLTNQFSACLERPITLIYLRFFTPDQTKSLIQFCLPEESLEASDFAQLIQMTEGLPGRIQALCQDYQASVEEGKTFSDFLAQREKQRLLSEIVQARLEPLEAEAMTNSITARALNLLKQAAWLGDHRIPFTFFLNEYQQVDLEAIQMLYDKQLAILDINRVDQSLKLNEAFLSEVQKRYPSEHPLLFAKNIQRLSEVFSYLTDNESVKGRQSRPKDLEPYVDLVQTLLFEPRTAAFVSENQSLMSQVLALGSSLARFYYLHRRELQQARDYLQSVRHASFFKQGLPEKLIEQFERTPENFTAPPIGPEEAKLLKLYAEEYLYQDATLASQLVPRGQVAPEVIQDFKKSYAIQRNLDKQGDPEAIAYTLRNLTRALRKQENLEDTLKEYGKLRRWMGQNTDVFDERVCAELLVDEGIIKKEAEDNKPESQRNYQPAIDTLRETHHIYLKHKSENQAQALGMLSIYLGDAHLAAGDFEEGVMHTCQILYYDGKRKEKQARAYFNLARAFEAEDYIALAKLFIDQAAPLQINFYRSTTEALRLKIEQKLLQRHKQGISRPINTEKTLWASQAGLTEYCQDQLVKGNAPSKRLSRDQIQLIEAEAYDWLARHPEAYFETQQAALTKEMAAFDLQEKAQMEKRALQLEQDQIWYSDLAQRIDLDDPKNGCARLFADQFKVELLHRIIQQLRQANGEEMLLEDKAELVEKLVQAVSGVLSKIEFDATTGITGAVDLAAILQLVTQTLSKGQKADAQYVADLFEDPEKKAKTLQMSSCIEQQIEEMACYAARCWQPMLSEQILPDSKKDIETLAAYGAERVIAYLKTGRAKTLSAQEQVVLALMTGEATAGLTQHKARENGDSWTVHGFFAQPGIKVDREDGQEVYLPSWQARPDVYGYRLGSPVEARIRPYYGPFKNEADARLPDANRMHADRLYKAKIEIS